MYIFSLAMLHIHVHVSSGLYSRICDNYVSFVKRHRLLTERLIKQGFWFNKLSVSFKKFSRRHSMLFNKYAVSVKRHIREGIIMYSTRCKT